MIHDIISKESWKYVEKNRYELIHMIKTNEKYFDMIKDYIFLIIFNDELKKIMM